MSLISEYINKGWGIPEFESELLKLIKEYNKLRNTYLFVYSASILKPIPAVALEQDDFYTIRDMLADKNKIKKIDIYIETPGGRGETAEDIVRLLREKFDDVSFVISGEAKSAGTIIVLSGDEILMTETGRLGPIDAQVRVGRSVISAHDYVVWVNEKRKEAEENGQLNPFDALMIAQITPGELSGVLHALKFAEDLVIEWLPKYKFKRWNITQSKKTHVTEEMKKKKAEDIAKELTDHSKWRSHGRSLCIHDLEKIGLQITKIDDNAKLAEIVYRIQTICKLIFEQSSSFKIFATQDNKIFKQAMPVGTQMYVPNPAIADVTVFEQKCPKCSKTHKVYAKLIDEPKIDRDYQKKGFIPFPKKCKIVCDCGFEMDLLGLKNKIEAETRKKIIVD